jgi:hypothetical protein
MPPEQDQGLLDFVGQGFDLGAHGANSPDGSDFLEN